MTECVCKCSCVAVARPLNISGAMVIGIILGVAVLITIWMIKD